MGGQQTKTEYFYGKQPPEPQPIKLPSSAWRNMFDWNDLSKVITKLRNDIENYTPLHTIECKDVNIKHVNIMLLGPTGSGKSSFLNSVRSSLLGRIDDIALAGYAGTSLTKRFTRYPVPLTKKKKPLRLKFSDMRGLEDSYIMSEENARLFLLGHISDNMSFEGSDVSVDEGTPGYIKSPKLDDRIMCCVIVIDATKVDVMYKSVVTNIKGAKTVMDRINIKYVVLLTKIDKLCTFTNEKVSNAFKSSSVEKCVSKVSELYGIQRNNVYPLKNYESEMTTNDEMDAIILFTLNEIINKAEYSLVNQYGKLKHGSDLKLWRSIIDWSSQYKIAEDMESFFETYSPTKDNDSTGKNTLQANLLLLGPVGAGKSSFVNTVVSIFRGEMFKAAHSGNATISETIRFNRYKIKLRDKKDLPIRLCDMRGLEDDCLITEENAKLLLKGHIGENMEFNPSAKVSPGLSGFNLRPTDDDRIACVILVIDANSVSVLAQKVVDNIKTFQKVMKELAINAVILLTKVDDVYTFSDDNIPEIFQNKTVEGCVKNVASLFDVAETHVFPLKNYKSETQLNNGLNVLVYHSLREALKMAENTLEKFQQQSRCLADKQWRKLYSESEIQECIESLEKSLDKFENPCVNILLIGSVGAGKSSFINTVNSVFRGTKFEVASSGNTYKSLTKKFTRYQIKRSNDKDDVLPVRLCDMRGLDNSHLLKRENVKLLLEGHIKNDSEFNGAEEITNDSPCYNPKPTLDDRISSVAFVIDGNTVEVLAELSPTVLDNIRDIQNILLDFRIQPVVVLTKIDKVCPISKENASQAFQSLAIKSLTEKVATMFALPLSNVLPIKNYEDEIHLKDEINAITLSTLMELLKKSEACLNNIPENEYTVSWRKTVNWKHQDQAIGELNSFFENYSPIKDSSAKDLETTLVNILLLGPKAAGKTSFINTVSSVFQGEIFNVAMSGSSSKIEKFHRYQIKFRTKEYERRLPVRFCDMQGLEEDYLITKANVKLALKGNIGENMNFDISSPTAPDCPGFEMHPTLNDRVMCAVIVVDASTIDTISEETPNIIQNIRDAQEVMKEQDVQQVILLTKVDQMFSFTDENAAEIFRNTDVKHCVDKAAKLFGLTPNCVFPVKNSENQLNKSMNLLTMFTLKEILKYAEVSLANCLERKRCDATSRTLGEWRETVNWDSRSETKEKLEQAVELFNPSELSGSRSGIRNVNLLLIGPAGAGKSSFVNTVISVFRDRRFEVANTGKDFQRLTKRFTRYPIRSNNLKKNLPIRICDMRGIEEECIITNDNAKLVLEGKIKHDTNFDGSLRDIEHSACYNSRGTPDDMIHCGVIVIDANSVEHLTEFYPNIIKNIHEIQGVMNDLDIPHVVVLTKIDRICQMTEQNVADAFRSPVIKGLVNQVAGIFSINPSSVLPMKNYESEMRLKDNIDILALYTLSEILTKAEACLTKQSEAAGEQDGACASEEEEGEMWRETINWDSKLEDLTELKKKVESFEPLNDIAPGVFPNLNILCMGPVGSGKSSFINTVLSAFQGRIFHSAKRGTAEKGTTKRLMWYPVMSSETKKTLPLRLFDMQGLLEDSLLTPENATLLLKGNVANRTAFNLSEPFKSGCQGFVENPEPQDKIMCGIAVIDAAKVKSGEIGEGVVQNIRDIFKVMDDLDIPHVILLTKIDQICPKTRDSVANAFCSTTVEECVEKVAEMFELTSDSVFPMKNYEKETKLVEDVSLMTLYTLSQILNTVDAGLMSWYSSLEDE